jgi:inosine-uridine nucleoside N-ribohydrolase
MPSRSRKIPLLVDCDTGIDDSLALLYAAASPECELVAVTCSAGNVEARQVATNTRAVLELAGRPDVEVAIGREMPLSRPLVITPETHGPRGIGYAELPPPTAPLSPRFGPDVIVEEARRRPGEVTLVALAPLTNVALAVMREPDLPRLLRRLVIMGGSYRSSGNTAPTTEWNVSCDPEAAKIVFDAFGSRADREGEPSAAGAEAPADVPLEPEIDSTGTGVMAMGVAAGQLADWPERSPKWPRESPAWPERKPDRHPDHSPRWPERKPDRHPEHSPRWPERSPDWPARTLALGLDVTERAVMMPEHLERLAAFAGCAPDGHRAGAAPNAVVRYLADAMRFYMEFHSKYDGFYGAFIHDPLALAAALDPGLVRTVPLTVDVELAGLLTTGETVADWRHRWGRPPNADVAVDVNASLFLERFLERVGGLAAQRQGPD